MVVKKIQLICDGSAIGNPGPGPRRRGWQEERDRRCCLFNEDARAISQ